MMEEGKSSKVENKQPLFNQQQTVKKTKKEKNFKKLVKSLKLDNQNHKETTIELNRKLNEMEIETQK